MFLKDTIKLTENIEKLSHKTQHRHLPTMSAEFAEYRACYERMVADNLRRRDLRAHAWLAKRAAELETRAPVPEDEKKVKLTKQQKIDQKLREGTGWMPRGQGKVTRGWTKVMDHTAYIGQANGFQGRCPPDWALELAMSCNTLKPKSKINSCLSDEEWIQKQGVAGRGVLHEWAEPLIKEANEYGGYITAQRPTMVECWIRVQTRNPNDLLLNMTPEKGSVVYLSPGASIDFIRNSGFACVWSDDEESNDSLIGEQYSEAEDAKHRDAYQELD